MITLSLIAPVAGALVLALVPSKKRSNPSSVYVTVAVSASLIALVASIIAAADFQNGVAGFQIKETWVGASNGLINWVFALDGISLGLYLLTTILFPLGIYYSYTSFKLQADEGKRANREKLFYISLLILETSVIGVFTAINLVVFYLFWELMLIPMVLLIGIWGGADKKYATIKFFIYTFGGSVFLLLGIIVISFYPYGARETLDLGDFLVMNIGRIPAETREYLFWAFILSFLIKIPAFPVHTWLPHAHTQAPTVGSIILAGVLLKMGTYGILRFSIGLFPLISAEYSTFFMVAGVIGIIYGAWLAWAQTDIKKLVAYSSVSHMGYIIMGMFAGNEAGLQGSYMQMINHGISTGLLFMLVGMIYDRTHTRKIADYGGLAKKSPLYALIFMIATLSSVGLPGTNGFVGEFLILLGTYQSSPLVAVFAVTGVIFGAVYMLHLYKEVFFGPVSDKLKEASDKVSLKINKREAFLTLPFVIMIFVLGFKPGIVLDSSAADLKPVEHGFSESDRLIRQLSAQKAAVKKGHEKERGH